MEKGGGAAPVFLAVGCTKAKVTFYKERKTVGVGEAAPEANQLCSSAYALARNMLIRGESRVVERWAHGYSASKPNHRLGQTDIICVT